MANEVHTALTAPMKGPSKNKKMFKAKMKGRKEDSGEEPSDESDAPPARAAGELTCAKKRRHRPQQTPAEKREICVDIKGKRFLFSFWGM